MWRQVWNTISQHQEAPPLEFYATLAMDWWMNPESTDSHTHPPRLRACEGRGCELGRGKRKDSAMTSKS